MSVHGGSDGWAELSEPSIAAALRARAARAQWSEDEPAAVLVLVQGWLASRGRGMTADADRLGAARVTAGELLQMLDTTPSEFSAGGPDGLPATAGLHESQKGNHAMTTLTEVWRKGSRSNNNGACLLVRQIGEAIQLRDSKVDGDAPAITLSRKEWDAFVAGIEDGEFVPA